MSISELTGRQEALAVIALCEAKADIATLERTIDAALEDGVAVADIKEALSQLYAYTGFPRSLNALGALQRVAERRARSSKTDVAGRDASPLPADFDALRAGTAVQTRLSGKPFNYAFAPATDYYLKAHLFGDIFGRDNLSHADRELVTICALAGLQGVEPQLQAHVAGASRLGLSHAAIHAIPATLRRAGDDMAAYRAARAIAAVYAEPLASPLPLGPTDFPQGTPNTAYAQYFSGNSYLATLAQGTTDGTPGGVPVHNVTFEPGCRNAWHIHHKAVQVLIVVKGRGWYAEWGKQPRELHAGDVVEIPEGVKHWHGAARDSWFQHVVFAISSPGAGNEWLEPVSDDDYDRLP